MFYEPVYRMSKFQYTLPPEIKIPGNISDIHVIPSLYGTVHNLPLSTQWSLDAYWFSMPERCPVVSKDLPVSVTPTSQADSISVVSWMDISNAKAFVYWTSAVATLDQALTETPLGFYSSLLYYLCATFLPLIRKK